MEKAAVVEIENEEGQIGYVIIGTSELCLRAVSELDKAKPNGGFWYEIGYYERDNRNPGKSIVVWRYLFRTNKGESTVAKVSDKR